MFPTGGSTGLGALGYALRVEELADQLTARGTAADYVVFASGSGGTHAGLLLGAALFRPPFTLVAINVEKADNAALGGRTREVYAQGADLLGLPSSYDPPKFVLRPGYVGKGYGVLYWWGRK